jgi:hypothetical protein
MGPITYAQHLMSTPRLPFTAAYFGSIALTLYFSLGVSTSVEPQHCFLANLISLVAPKYNLDLDLIHYAVGLFVMVSSQLFPHGLERAAACDNFRSSKSCCVSPSKRIVYKRS